MLKRVASIGSYTMNSKMQEAVSSDLNGLLSGGRPPEKLLQVGLVHIIFPSRGSKVSCHVYLDMFLQF
jgi:hypothetical protein